MHLVGFIVGIHYSVVMLFYAVESSVAQSLVK